MREVEQYPQFTQQSKGDARLHSIQKCKVSGARYSSFSLVNIDSYVYLFFTATDGKSLQ
jgi:hypothetical protein